MRRLICIAGLVASTALLAGCGSDGDTLTKDEYQEQVTAAGKDLAASFEEIGKQAQGLGGDVSSADDLKDVFADVSEIVAGAEDNLRAAADELESLSPPEEAAEANQKLVDGLNQIADDFGDLASALDEGSVADIAALGVKLRNITVSEGGRLIQEAIRILERAGYRFSDLG